MLKDDVFAEKVIKAFEELNKWYMYEGGKAYFEKIERQEEMDRARLKETRLVVQIWKEKAKHLSPDGLVIMEQCCYLTLCLDWGESAMIYFDYKNMTATCKLNNTTIII